MMGRVSRRRFLRGSTIAGIGILAGCLGDGDGPTGTHEPPANSPITEVTVDRSDLVISLREGNRIRRLNLIGPDGKAVGSTSVATGETTARIQLLDIKPGLGGYEHYEPGTHELVAVTESGSPSMDLELVPDLRIVDVEQYRGGSKPSDLGKLAVTIENVGTGPTWVYDITYRGAPNSTANDPLINDPGVPRIAKPHTPIDAIIGPDQEQYYVSSLTPIQFNKQSTDACRGSFELSLVIGVAGTNNIHHSITAEVSGHSEPVGLMDQFTCSDVSIVLNGQKETDVSQIGVGE